MIALFTVPGRGVFEPISKQCGVLLRAANLMRQCLTDRGPDLIERAVELGVEERELVTMLTSKLTKALVTPVNHEDLMVLSSWIRRVRREVTRAAQRSVAFGAPATPEIEAMTAVTERTCALLSERVERLQESLRPPADFFAFHRAADEARAIARQASPGILSGANPLLAIQEYEIVGFLFQANLNAKKTADWIDYTVVRNG